MKKLDIEQIEAEKAAFARIVGKMPTEDLELLLATFSQAEKDDNYALWDATEAELNLRNN